MVAEAGASSQGPSLVPAWVCLREAADLASYRPCLRDGVIWKQLTTTRGEEYVVVQNPAAATYLRLSPEDLYIFQLMDGSHSVQQLVVEYVLKYQRFALQHLLELVQELRASEFLRDAPSFTYPRIRRLARPPTFRARLDNLLNLYLNREFPIRGVDAAFDKLYSGGAWLLLTTPGLILLAIVTLIGIPLLARDLHVAHIALTDRGLLARYAALAYVSLLAIAIIHELGHAFAVKSYGRSVRRGGLGLFYGSPCMYVDTQDMWMAPRGQRIAASWAGPYSGFILAGLAGLALTFLPHGGWVTFARAFGIMALIENAFQLNPFIQYDGYYILMDWLDIYNLRRRALTFLRFDLRRKIWRHERFNHEELVFTVFGTLASAYTVFAIFMVVTFGWGQAQSAIQSAVRVPNLQSLLLAVLLSMILIPFAIGVAGRLLGLVGSIVRAVRRATGAARDRWYRERATLLSQVPALATLGDAPVETLAAHLREQRFKPGAAVVRQGEPGNRFYLIVDGKAEVFVSGPDGSRLVSELGPMDYFGERALLEEAPRAATVRAKTRLRLVSLGAKEFRASIRPYISADAALHQRLDELAELDGFPVLQPLAPREREILLARLRPRSFAAGETIISQGDAGADFYLLRSGRVEVSRRDDAGNGTILQTLAAGDFFGEIALLLDAPRVATVRAVEPAGVWALSRQDFTDLLSGYFNLEEQLAPVVQARLSEDRLVLTETSDGSRLPAAGGPAPAFELGDDRGQRVSLSGYRGRPVLLWFSPGEDGAYDAELRAALPGLAENGIVVLRIVPADPAPAEEGRSEIRTLRDPDQVVYRAFGMYSVRERVPDPSEASGDDGAWSGSEWKRVLSRALEQDTAGREVAALDEGLALIRADGSIAGLISRQAGEHLPATPALLNLLVAPPRLPDETAPSEGTSL